MLTDNRKQKQKEKKDMTKKEISEVRKRCKKADNSFTRICGCYVHGEDRQTDTFAKKFQMLSEEDAYKYIDIFKKALSGSLNKNLFNVPFGYGSQGSIHEALDTLVRTGLDDEESLDTLYDAVISSYDKAENYIILFIHNRYDVPGKAQDGTEMEDASDEVYSYLSCAICPVSLSKPGLAYQGDEGFSSLKQDWVAGMPETAFLYPSFNGRSTDTGEVLYYSSDAKHTKGYFVKYLFGNALPMPADTQKECFARIVEEILDGPTGYSEICEMKDCLDELATADVEAGGGSDAGMLKAEQVKAIIEEVAGREIRDDEFQAAVNLAGWENGSLYVGNLTDIKTFEIRTPGMLVRVNEGMTARPEIRKIDGRNCIVVPIEGTTLTVNGIAVSPSCE